MSSGSICLLPREKHKDPYCQLNTRFCCSSRSCKGARKMACRMVKSKALGSCLLDLFSDFCCLPQRLWLMLANVKHNWVETKSHKPLRGNSEASGSGSDCPQSSQYEWSHSSPKLWWARYPNKHNYLNRDWGNRSTRPWINP